LGVEKQNGFLHQYGFKHHESQTNTEKIDASEFPIPLGAA
jgi:hypothetical protein